MGNEVLFEVKNEIAVITLNRPERRNAINQALLTRLYDSIERVASDKTLKAAVITGRGKAFCSGIDLASLEKENLFDPRGDGKDMPEVFSLCEKPLIGAVNGHAITGGFELALNCDFLISSDNAVFADTHAKVGIQPGWGMSQMLQQAIGQRMAKQFSLTCAPISAEKALQLGLVNEVVSADRLMERAFEIAGDICQVNYDMVMKIKRLIENRNHTTFEKALLKERDEFLKFIEDFK